MAQRYDVIIIGSGAGGATLAHALADTGKSILILERGPMLPIEADNWSAQAVFIDGKYAARERWIDQGGKPFDPRMHYFVGGQTSFYGAALMRMKPRDFEEVRHAGGISPAWPLRYADWAPWYAAAEALWEVHGERHIDPCDPPDDPPYPFPALTHDPGVAQLADHFRALGWHPSPLPLGVRRNDANPAAAPCLRCHTCGGFPCRALAKVDARTAVLPGALAHDNVTLLAGRKALRIETDASGRRATAVVIEAPAGEERIEGGVIVTSAGAANSAALWLRSASDRHPAGLANGSGLVGRNYMFHTTSAVIALSLEHFQADFPKTLCVNDFYFGEPDGSFAFPMGQIQMLEYMSGQTLKGQLGAALPAGLIPDFLADAVAGRMVPLLAMSEDLPNPANRITTGPDGQIHLAYDFGDLTAHNRLVQRLRAGLDGFVSNHHVFSGSHIAIDQLIPIMGTAHQCGTLRFGDDPASSVLDRACKAHELDNLYAVDASFFVSSAAVNPTLTIVANALRVAAELRTRL